MSILHNKIRRIKNNVWNQRMKRELLEKLYHEAVDFCVEFGPNPDGTNKAWLWEEKFAELIVQECLSLQHKNVIVGGVSEYNRGRREFAEDMLKHFGIEE